MAASRTAVPVEFVEKLRAICLALPGVYEEAAWTGTRWMIGKRNLAHVVMIDQGWPPAYAKAAGSNGPLAVLTFRVPQGQREAMVFRQRPFFKPVWWPDIAGVALDAGTDWDGIARRLADSYLALAPKRLIVDAIDHGARTKRV
ncbi:hypothetical protein [Pseudoxanthomonas putridarboris]|uniref:YjbR protein n=1 Tax=Pseudoxanthomonas putridarboris TaxID=752605 RepID=A0ABU9J3D5_9GAMM